jgi:hypothetical protein
MLVTASVVPTSPILVTLMKEALTPSEISVLTRATRRNITENAILHSHRRKNLKSYNFTYYLISQDFYQLPVTKWCERKDPAALLPIEAVGFSKQQPKP